MSKSSESGCPWVYREKVSKNTKKIMGESSEKIYPWVYREKVS